MTAAILALTLSTAIIIPAYGNYYFTTHETYKTSTYNITSYLVVQVAGDVVTVTQQCRRNCAVRSNCAAYSVTLQSGNQDVGVFYCHYFTKNACRWQWVALNATLGSNLVKLWEKLDAKQYKPKPCIEYCQVQYQGNCTACRGYNNLSGLDCDIAPQFCSGYSYNDWSSEVPIWPWGFYGKKLVTYCYQDRTLLIGIKNVNLSTSIFSIGQDRGIRVQSMDAFQAWQESIDWELISELSKLARKKILHVRLVLDIGPRDYSYGGLRVSPRGDLSINGSLNTIVSSGIPLPLTEVPFVYDAHCGAFWQFNQTVSLCNQRSVLFNYTGVRWDGYNQAFNAQTVVFMR